MNAISIVSALALGVWVMSSTVFAHHSEALFEANKRVTIIGSIQSAEWSNPHGRITLNVETVDGQSTAQPELWVIETDAPGKLKRLGWTQHTLTPGDRITLDISPMRSTSRRGFARDLTWVNGNAMAGLKR